MRTLIAALLLLSPAAAWAQQDDEPPPQPPPSDSSPAPTQEPPPPSLQPPGALQPPTGPVAPPAAPPPAAPAAAAAPAPEVFHARGFAFGASYEVAPAPIGGGPDSISFGMMPTTRLFAGYQADRITFGLTFDVERESGTQDDGSGMPVDVSMSTLLIGPAVRLTMATSETGATELLGIGDVGFRIFGMSSSDGAAPPDLGNVIVMHVGPSLRYWLGPHFALAATAAARIEDFSPGGNADSAFGVQLGYSIDALGVF